MSGPRHASCRIPSGYGLQARLGGEGARDVERLPRLAHVVDTQDARAAERAPDGRAEAAAEVLADHPLARELLDEALARDAHADGRAGGEAAQGAKEREVFKRPIAKFQGIQWMLADAATQVEAARMLTYYAADLKEQGVPFTKQAAMAKIFAAEAAHKVVDTSLQIHGGYGYMKEYPIERIYRDQRITELFEGTSQVQKIVIAGQLLH